MRQRVYIIGVDNALGIDLQGFRWPKIKERPKLSEFLIDENNHITAENKLLLERYLDNSINKGKAKIKDLLSEEMLVIDTRMSDLRLYRERVPTLRSHRDGIFYTKNKTLRELTGVEALMLQGFPKELIDRVYKKVSNRHLLMQAGNAMTTNVIQELGKSLLQL